MRGIHRWPVNSPHKGPVTRKMFPSDDVIMKKCPCFCSCIQIDCYTASARDPVFCCRIRRMLIGIILQVGAMFNSLQRFFPVSQVPSNSLRSPDLPKANSDTDTSDLKTRYCEFNNFPFLINTKQETTLRLTPLPSYCVHLAHIINYVLWWFRFVYYRPALSIL